MAIDSKNADSLQALANKYQIEITKLGTTGGDALKVNETTISITELNKAFTETLPKLFAEQINFILQEEKIERCVLIGHSMGGYTAMQFAKYFPEKFCESDKVRQRIGR